MSTPFKPHLVPGVAGADAFAEAPRVADRDDERVDAVPLAAGVELREDRGRARVLGGAADPVLARGLARACGSRRSRVGVPRRDRLEVRDVGAVADLAHREQPGSREARAGEEGATLRFGAEEIDAPAEEAELDADI